MGRPARPQDQPRGVPPRDQADARPFFFCFRDEADFNMEPPPPSAPTSPGWLRGFPQVEFRCLTTCTVSRGATQVNSHSRRSNCRPRRPSVRGRTIPPFGESRFLLALNSDDSQPPPMPITRGELDAGRMAPAQRKQLSPGSGFDPERLSRGINTGGRAAAWG